MPEIMGCACFALASHDFRFFSPRFEGGKAVLERSLPACTAGVGGLRPIKRLSGWRLLAAAFAQLVVQLQHSRLMVSNALQAVYDLAGIALFLHLLIHVPLQ